MYMLILLARLLRLLCRAGDENSARKPGAGANRAISRGEIRPA
jgi:hypothetical protein